MKGKDSKGRKLKEGETQDKDGRYRYRYTDTDGKRRSVYSWRLVASDRTPEGKKICAPLRELELEIKIKLSEGICVGNGSMTVNQLMERYFSTKTELAVSTKNNYLYLWEKNLKNHPLGSKAIRDVRKTDILCFYAHLSNDLNFCSGTIQMYQNIIYPAFQLAVDDRIIPLNPCNNCMKQYNVKAMESKKVPLKEEEIEVLYRYAKNDPSYARYYELLVFMLETGCRMSEAAGMTWRDIDFDNRKINVNHQVLYRKKDRKTVYYATPTKNKKSRDIPMSQFLYDTLLKYRTETYLFSQAADFSVDGYHGFVFLNKNGKPLTQNTVDRAFHSMTEAFNRLEAEDARCEDRDPVIVPFFSPHVLRHTFATRKASSGCDVKVLQELMGHSNINVTMMIYNHADFDRLQKEIERLDRLDKGLLSPDKCLGQLNPFRPDL